VITKKLLSLVFVGSIAAAQSATAERWIQYPEDEWSWIDLDSVSRDTQGLVHVREHMGKNPSGPEDRMFNYHEDYAYDCKSRKRYSFQTKKWYDVGREWVIRQVCG
jgi:hypothetical protein